MELIEALEQTFDHTASVIDAVRPDQYDTPTPCPDWVVRDLLAHTIGVVEALGATISGAPAPEFALAADPAAQFRDVAAVTLAAWRAPDVLDRDIQFGPGQMTGRALAGINLLDTATHAWDIAIACGQPAALPAGVAETALAVSRVTISAQMRPGRFGPELAAPPDADPTAQLVAYLGREPGRA